MENITEKYISEKKSISMIDIVFIFWSEKNFVVKVTGVVTLIAVIVSLLLPNYYKSTATLLPNNTSGSGGFSGISELASLAGVNLGNDDQEKLYPLIINSEAVLKNVIYSMYTPNGSTSSVNLITFWDIDQESPNLAYEAALKTMRDALNVSLDLRANTISVSIETKDPQVSADILNNIVTELDFFMKSKKVTFASEQRRWISTRLTEVEQDLKKSENALKNFRENNRMIGNSPELMLIQGRLMREVEINQTLYIELKKQFEFARIEEVKTTPIISVLDKARPAAKKERPKRFLIVLFFFSMSLLVTASFITIKHFYREPLIKLLQIFKRR